MGEVDLLLDASYVVALLTLEPSSERAVDFALRLSAPAIASDLTAAEYASAISRRVRMRELTRQQGQFALETFDDWSDKARWVAVSANDIAIATGFLRRLDLPLRTADAIHIAMARRLAAALVTFDLRMAEAARALGVMVADI